MYLIQKAEKGTQGYSTSVAVLVEPTMQAWRIIIQMFSTGTLNGIQTRLALRKILITHLISHCTSYAPGGAPGCECEYEREGEGGRDERCLLLQPPSGNGIYFGVKMQMRKTTREEAVSFSSQPMSLCPRRASHNTMGMRGRMKRDQLHV